MSKVLNNETKDDCSTTYKTKSYSKSIFIKNKTLGLKRKRNNIFYENESNSVSENLEGINDISFEELSKEKENEEINLINLKDGLLNKNYSVYQLDETLKKKKFN
jgi:hypothetical protein